MPEPFESFPARPKLRTDLSYVAQPPGRYFVSVPGRPPGVSLDGLEVALARLFDGHRNEQQVLDEATKAGIAAGAESLTQLARKLATAGFFDGSESEMESALRAASLGADEDERAQPTQLLPKAEDDLPAEPSPASDDLKELIEADDAAVATRNRRKRRRRLYWLVALAASGIAMVLVEWPDRITEPCQLTPKHRAVVRANIDGMIEKVLVEEGQRVTQGQLLVKLSDFDARKQLDRIDAELARAKAEYRLLQRGARPEEINRLEQILAGRIREARIAGSRRARLKSLASQQLASREELDAAISDVVTKQGAIAEARASLKLLRAGPNPEDLIKRESEIKSIEVQRTLALPNVAATELKSPIDGMVRTPKLSEKVGSMVAVGLPVIEVIDSEVMIAEVYVPQGKLDSLKIGLPVTAKVASLPASRFEGKVTFIGMSIEKHGDPPTEFIRVESELDNRAGELRAQMTGFAEIDTGRRPLGELLFRGLVRWIRYRFVI